MFTDAFVQVHHPTATEWGHAGFLDTTRRLWRAENLSYRLEPLATLGESLVLVHQSVSASGTPWRESSIGPYETEELMVVELDADGREWRGESFACDHLGNAVARLYERYAELLPDGNERTRAAATARSVAARPNPLELDSYAASLAPAIELVDHRRLATLSASGADAVLAGIDSWREVADDTGIRQNEILGLRPDALLVRAVFSGIARDGGGAFERPTIALLIWGVDGRTSRVELFDPEREADALARFDELTTPPVLTRIVETAATRAIDRFDRAWAARDWQAICALNAPELRYSDRRALMQLELDRETFLEFIRPLFEMQASRISQEVLATRGDRLVLTRLHFEGSDGSIGPSETESLTVAEVDDRGNRIALIRFDPDKLDAAYAELDRRYAAGEAAAFPHVAETMRAFREAFARRDWDALAARMSSDLVVDDHRLLGWETVRGADAYVQTLHSLVDLAPDAQARLDHVEMSQLGLLWIGAWVGTRDGGAFETPWITVSEHDARGIVLRFDQYDLNQLAAARARFDELRPDPLRIPPNAATRARDRSFEAWHAGDWDALRALAANDFCFEDRSKRGLVEGGVDLWIESFQFFRSEGARPSRELIGTAGDRIAIEHVRWTRAPTQGAFDLERLTVTEVDADGQLRSRILFDPDDRRAAFEEAQARFLTGEAAGVDGQAPIAAFSRAFTRHDREQLQASIASDAVFCDRRSPSLLGTLARDEYIESVTAFAELAPDLAAESFQILAWNERGRVDLTRRFGTRDGGPFENFFARVFLTAGDRIQRFEMFDADAALARFAELCAD